MNLSGKRFTSAKNIPAIIAFSLSAIISSSASAAILINEVDYDQPGSDTAEFIELFNNGNSSTSLDGYRIDLINGSNSRVYRQIDLSGFTLQSKNYFVVCNDPSQVANCNDVFTSSTGWIQNGAPDALALYDNENNRIDSLAYEGTLSPFTETAATNAKDSNTVITSLSRLPDGTDSNNNQTDFNLGCLTPGTANIAGTGNCSTNKVSAVPLPAAIWLFASGLLGLTGINRARPYHSVNTSS